MTSGLAIVLGCLLLVGCEPCAVVLGGHCTGAQHDEDFDKPGEPGEQILAPPAPLYMPHTRG